MNQDNITQIIIAIIRALAGISIVITIRVTQKQDVLNEAIAIASKKLQDLKEAEVQVQAQFNKGEITEEQFRALQREIESTTIKLHGYESQLKNINQTGDTTATNTKKIGTEAEGTGGKFSAFAVAAGTALGNLLANGVQNLISGIQTLGQKIKEQITGLAEYADNVNTLAAKYQVSTDKIQQWMYQAKIADTEVDAIGSSHAKLIRAMAQAQKGTEDQVKAFKALSVEYEDGNKKLRDADDVFNDAIKSLGNFTARISIPMGKLGNNS